MIAISALLCPAIHMTHPLPHDSSIIRFMHASGMRSMHEQMQQRWKLQSPIAEDFDDDDVGTSWPGLGGVGVLMRRGRGDGGRRCGAAVWGVCGCVGVCGGGWACMRRDLLAWAV